jgi:hypothetical protein
MCIYLVVRKLSAHADESAAPVTKVRCLELGMPRTSDTSRKEKGRRKEYDRLHATKVVQNKEEFSTL